MTVEAEEQDIRNSGSLTVVERILTTKNSSLSPGVILHFGTTSLEIIGSNAIGTIELGYDEVEAVELTDFLICRIEKIDLIAAIGFHKQISYHKHRVKNKTLTRLPSCACATPSTSNNIFNGFYVIFAVCIASLFNF